MNILITGASRGIGAAAYALLKRGDHRVVGHSTKGSDVLIAGDLTHPSAPRNIWDTALAELDGQIDVLVNNAGIYEGVADNATDDESASRRYMRWGLYLCPIDRTPNLNLARATLATSEAAKSCKRPRETGACSSRDKKKPRRNAGASFSFDLRCPLTPASSAAACSPPPVDPSGSTGTRSRASRRDGGSCDRRR